MNLRKHRHRLWLVIVYLSLPLFISLTNPNRLPLPLLIVPFLLLFLVVYVSINMVIRNNRRQKVLIAGSGASVPVLLLIFQSIHQLTLRDVLIVLGLVGITMFYLSHADFIP